MLKTRISVPKTAKSGELIEIKTLISHPMESGFRRDLTGNPIARNIITDFVCIYNGKQVFRAEFFPAVAANPYLSFFIIATASGKLEFQWRDQEGNVTRKTAEISVE